MFIARKHVAAVVAALVLSGCGAPVTGLVAPSKLGKSAPAPSVSVVAAPGVTVTRGNSVSRQNLPAASVKASTLQLVENTEMSQEEVAALADSLGYNVQAESSMGSLFGESGMVRTTESGFAFVVTKGIFKKTDTVYTLDASGDLADQLASRQNKKAFVKGVLYENNHVKVSTVKSELNLSALFNVFTKGKVAGHVDGQDGQPLGGVKVTVKSARGFTYSALSGADGDYTIKGLEPGDYTATLSKEGFKGASKAITVSKRHSLKLQGDLAAADAPVVVPPADTTTP